MGATNAAETDAAKPNLIQKLAKIRGIAEVVKKDKQGYGYTYADITQILAKITAGMKKYGVSLIPSIVPQTSAVTQVTNRTTKFKKNGEAYENVTCENLVTADMAFTWVNDDDPTEKIEVPWFVTGSQSDPSQAFGSGLTYCTRYFLTSYFQIAQSDLDVDAYRSKQREAEMSESKSIAAEIVHNIDVMVSEYLAEHDDKKDDVKKFVGKYIKGADYRKIDKPEIAAKLLNDFKSEFIGEGNK